jgi:hypothetical protein
MTTELIEMTPEEITDLETKLAAADLTEKEKRFCGGPAGGVDAVGRRRGIRGGGVLLRTSCHPDRARAAARR